MILEIVAIVLIIFLLIILIILLVPFGVKLDFTSSISKTKTDVTLSWLGLTLWRTKPKKKDQEKEKKKAESRKFGFSKIIRMLSLVGESIPALTILVNSAKRAVRFRKLVADFQVGLGDPAETALLAGYVWACGWVLNRIPRVSFSFYPDFQSLKLESSVHAEARVQLFPLVVGFIRAYLKKPFRQLIKEARRRE